MNNCSNSSDCNSFFIYDDQAPSRACFKSKYERTGTHQPASPTYKDSAFYTLDRYKNIEENEAIMNDKCLESAYLAENLEKCCSGSKNLIGARRPMCEALPVWQNRLRVSETNYQNLKAYHSKMRKNFKDFAEDADDVVDANAVTIGLMVPFAGLEIAAGIRGSWEGIIAANEVPGSLFATSDPVAKAIPSLNSNDEKSQEKKTNTIIIDKNPSCSTWAKNGECEKNPKYMLPNCMKSCQEQIKKKQNSPKSSEDKLEDKNKNCQSWASSGECTKNPGYMLPNCAKSCHSIKSASSSPPSASLVDKNKNCESWAKSGECNKNPAYMLPNCAESCHNVKLSSAKPPTPVKPEKKCVGTVQAGAFKDKSCDYAYKQITGDKGTDEADTWCSGTWNTGCSLVNNA